MRVQRLRFSSGCYLFIYCSSHACTIHCVLRAGINRLNFAPFLKRFRENFLFCWYIRPTYNAPKCHVDPLFPFFKNIVRTKQIGFIQL